MAEALIAQLGLDLSGFTSGLQQAQAAMQAFAQQAAQAISQATNALSQQASAAQRATQATQSQSQATQQAAQSQQASTQSTNQLAAAYIAMAQAVQQQTAAYAQAQAAALQFKQAQAAAAQATQHATTIWDRFTRALTNTALYGSIFQLLSLIESIPTRISQGLLAATKGFAEFQEGILKIGSQIAGFTAGRAFEEMGAQVHALAVRFGRETSDISKALFELQGTFGDTAKAMIVLEASGQLAVGGFTNIFDASQAISSVLKGLKLEVSESAKVANALKIGSDQGRASVGEFAKSISGMTPTLSAFRVDLREANAALAVLTNQGYTTSEAVTALSRILFAIGAPTVRAKKYMEELAIQMGVAKIDFVRTKEGVVDLFATFQQFTSISPDLFRRIFGGSEVITKGIIGLTDHMGELRTKINEAVVGGDTLKKSQELAGTAINQAWKEVTETIRFFSDTLGAMIAQNPAVLTAVREIQHSFTDVRKSVEANKKELETLITLFARLGEIGVSVLSGISAAAVYLAGAVGSAIQAISAGISNVLKVARAVKDFVATGSGGRSGGPQFGGPGATYAGGMNPSGALTPEEQRWADAVKAMVAPAVPSGAIVSPAKPSPAFSLDNVDPGGGEKSNREAEKAARERERIEEILRDKLIELNNDTFDAAQKFLEQEVAEARKAGADKLLIAEYYKDQSAVIAHGRAMAEIQELMDGLQEEQRLREDDLKNQRVIADLLRETGAKTTKTQLDDIAAGYTKKREMLEEAGADEIQLAQLAANERAQLRKVSTEELQKQLDKERQAYEQLVSDIAKPIASVFQGILTGTGNLLDTLKQKFTTFLADLAAEVLTRKIIIPLVMQVLGGGSGGGGGEGGGFFSGLLGLLGTAGAGAAGTGTTGGMSGGGDVGSGLEYFGIAQQGISGASAISGAFGGPTLTSSLFGSSGALSGLAATELGELGISGAGYMGGEVGSLGGLSGTTLGTLGSGLAAGLAVGMLVNELNKLVGLSGGGIKGAAGGALAGAAGGAVAGSIIPVIGTAVGTIVGAALGAIAGGLFGGGPRQAELQVTRAQTPQVSFDPLTGLQLTTPFQILETEHQALRQQGTYEAFQDKLGQGVNELLQSVVDSFSSVAPQIQEGLVQPLNAIFASIAGKILHEKFEGEDWGKDLTEFFGTTLPHEIQTQLDPVLDSIKQAVQRISPVVNAFNSIIKQATEDIVRLSQQAAQQHLSLEQSIIGIQQGLFSPAQSFVAGQRQLQGAMALLDQATPSQRISLIPEIQKLAQQVFELAKNQAVLGQDPQALRNLQAELIAMLSGLQGTSTDAFGTITEVMLQQRDLAQAQITALVDALKNPASVPGVIQASLAQLQQIQATLAPFSAAAQQDVVNQVQTALLNGSVQALTSIDSTQQQALAVLQAIANSLIAAPGHQAGIAWVPSSGMAWLHAGERVVPAHENTGGNGGTITINISGGGGDSQAIAREVIQQIERRGGRLQGGRILVKN